VAAADLVIGATLTPGKLAPRLEPGARVYVESEAPVEVAAPWVELKRARAGQVSYQLLERR